MQILSSPQHVRERIAGWKKESKIAFVPTMGCLHEGHIALVKRAKQLAERTIVSIFVNPLQFGPNEDFDRYPRTLEQDKLLLERAGIDLLFHPTVEDLYPKGFSTRVVVGPLAENLCGKSRPGHFDGVATVCLKLFEIASADYVVMGKKDFQQLQVLKRMAMDFNLGSQIVGFPTVRELDGLALSSRNRYLLPDERQRANSLPRALSAARHLTIARKDVDVGEVLLNMGRELNQAGFEIDYCAVASEDDLTPQPDYIKIADVRLPRLFVAAKMGKTRLIDNMELGRKEDS
jgi:pantoate--beta-alanine ligase